ncbi:hypothetical protein RALTA_A0667 [Cupriavidus taiwanensis LMG 19424]|uniref:Uncharacterized protein n=2 Tax=Cupriavidus taiwanensis TaxID=164546 RepID=B3R2W5_CUPTR|nr:hypothetical protein RALTA_A0667 [Cupriavidus taiwanensis LMG 19424]SPC06924.1 conserved hypothetical protein [Cupriavidus taiwanensis]
MPRAIHKRIRLAYGDPAELLIREPAGLQTLQGLGDMSTVCVDVGGLHRRMRPGCHYPHHNNANQCLFHHLLLCHLRRTWCRSGRFSLPPTT